MSLGELRTISKVFEIKFEQVFILYDRNEIYTGILWMWGLLWGNIQMKK